MLPPEKQAEQLNQELDRYLLAESDNPHTIPSEDQPELELGVQLLQVDFSEQSRLRAHLRHHLEKERGARALNSTVRLVQSAASRRHKGSIGKWSYWPVLLAVVIILSVWSFTSTTSSPEASISRPSPMVVVTAVLSASQQPSEPDPVPTPLAPPSTQAYHPSNTLPAARHTPFGLFITSPQVNQP